MFRKQQSPAVREVDGTSFTPPNAPIQEIMMNGRIVSDIHPNDDMSAKDNFHNYCWMGRTALDSIIEAAPSQRFRQILDFPSGYGRVLRFLRGHYPDAQITACDIIEEAVTFCADKFSAISVQSSEDLENLSFGDSIKFDLIWVGSLFTHLSEQRASHLLHKLSNQLSPNGYLVFSVAGAFVVEQSSGGSLGGAAGVKDQDFKQMIADFFEHGFGYGRYERALSADAGYGRAFVGRSWLERQRELIKIVDNVAYIHRGYARRQDVVVWRKSG